MKPITNLSEQGEDYCTALSKCKSLSELMELLESYRSICPDALKAAPRDKEEFAAFRSGLRKERSGVFAGEEFDQRFGSVLMPDLLIRVTPIAEKFCIPWGLAFIRLRDEGYIGCGEDGVFYWADK